MFSKQFLVDLAERTIWTFVQAFLGVLGGVPIAEMITDANLDGAQTVLLSAVGAGVSAVAALLKGVAAGRLRHQGTAQLIPGAHTYRHDDELESPDARVFD